MNMHKNAKLTPLGRERMVNLLAESPRVDRRLIFLRG